MAFESQTLRLQTNGSFTFVKGTSASASDELFRIATNGNIGIGTSSPVTRFSNTNLNVAGSDAIGVGPQSITWQTNGVGYVQGLYNASTATYANGLAVKIAGTNSANRILDLGANERPISSR